MVIDMRKAQIMATRTTPETEDQKQARRAKAKKPKVGGAISAFENAISEEKRKAKKPKGAISTFDGNKSTRRSK